MKVKEESEKVDLKLNIQKTKIMASGPITSWEIDGETVETVGDFIFLASKITADGDCSHEIKRHLLLGIYLSLPLYNIKDLIKVIPEWSSGFPYILQLKSEFSNKELKLHDLSHSQLPVFFLLTV